MTTVAQVKRVARPLLERNGDLALVGRLVIIKPVRHLLRGVFFDRGVDPIIFAPTWFVNFLFKPGASANDRWGERLYRKRDVPTDFTDPAVIEADMSIMAAQRLLPLRDRRYPESWREWVAYDPAVATEMCDVIEQEALPMLRAVQSIEDFVAFTGDKTRFPWTYLGSHVFNERYFFAAQGNFEAALAACTELAAGHPTSPATTELLPRLAGGDRQDVAQLLHGWEADSVKRLKLEEFWEPTPFPIELSAGRSERKRKARPKRRSAKR
jgi:hypothetical protein